MDQELYERRNLVRIECIRSTYFVETKEALPIICRAYKGGPSKRLLSEWRISPRFEEKQEVPTLSLLIMKKVEKPILNRVRLEAKAINNLLCGRKVQLEEQEKFPSNR